MTPRRVRQSWRETTRGVRTRGRAGVGAAGWRSGRGGWRGGVSGCVGTTGGCSPGQVWMSLPLRGSLGQPGRVVTSNLGSLARGGQGSRRRRDRSRRQATPTRFRSHHSSATSQAAAGRSATRRRLATMHNTPALGATARHITALHFETLLGVSTAHPATTHYAPRRRYVSAPGSLAAWPPEGLPPPPPPGP